MATAKVTSKGQITVPKEVRAKLGLAPGDELEFVEEGGRFVIRKRLRRSPSIAIWGIWRRSVARIPTRLLSSSEGTHDHCRGYQRPAGYSDPQH